MTSSVPPAVASRWRWISAVVVLGVLLHAASLGGGFSTDDHIHQLALTGKLPLRPWALYDFGTTADWANLPDQIGGVPWWTSPDWKVRFFRPLSSLSLALDHVLFGANAAAHHAVSLGWLGALLAVTYALGRALRLAPSVAIGTVALLASSGATVYPTDWLANRNSLLAATFCVGAVATIASHERLGRGRALAVAFALSGLACLSKESGVVAFGAVAAYLLLLGDGLPLRWSRSAAIAAAGSAAVYVSALAVAGYGTRSGFYATPWTDPGRFVTNLGRLAGAGALAFVTPVPSDLVFFLPDAAPVIVGCGAVIGGAVSVWMARRLRCERVVMFLAVWAALSLVPEAGAPVQDRLLLAATVPVSALLALLVVRTLPASAARPRWERVAAGSLVVLAGLESLATAAQSVSSVAMVASIREKALAADVGPAELGRREVFVLQVDDPLVAFTIPSTWAYHTGDLDVRFTALQTGRRGVRWTRVDERTMEFESIGRPFVTDPFERVHRSRPDAPAAGTVTEVQGLRFEVVASDPAGGVRTVRVRFAAPPDGPRFRFLAPRDGRLARVDPPAPGGTVTLPEAPRANPLVP